VVGFSMGSCVGDVDGGEVLSVGAELGCIVAVGRCVVGSVVGEVVGDGVESVGVSEGRAVSVGAVGWSVGAVLGDAVSFLQTASERASMTDGSSLNSETAR